MFLDRRFLQNKLLSSSSFTPLDTLNLNREKSLKLMSSPYTLSPILAVLLAACGGGGTVRVPVYLTDPDNQNPRPDGPGEPPVRPDGPGVGPGGDGDFNAQPFDIFVADGIIEGARVYVDINGNGQIDEGDVLIGTTDQTGAVRNIPGEYAGEQILADVAGALDLFTGETIPDGIVYRAKVNEFGRDDVVLSPISTAIADIVEALMAIEQQLIEEEATEQAFLRLFGANSGVTEEHLNDPDSFILPTDAAPKPLQSPGGIREKIATAAIKLQLLMEETPETEERIAKLIDADGFTDDDLQNPGTSTDRVNTARSIAQGKPLASPDADRGENPGNIDEDNALLIDVADWGFRDPVGNVNQEVSALVQLRIVGIELTRDDGSVLRGNAVGKLVLADGTEEITFPPGLENSALEVVTSERSLFKKRTGALNASLTVIDQNIRENVMLAENLKERMEIIKPLVEKGYEPRLTLLELESNYEQTVLAAQKARDEYKATIDNFRADAASQLAEHEVAARQAGAREDAYLAKVRHADVRAPSSGIVTSVKVKTVGAVLQAGTVLAEIVPDEQSLLIRARLPADDVANVYPGQIAQVSLSTYDVSRYGSLEGIVQRIAQNTTQEEGIPPYYVTMIEVPNPQFSKSETPVEITTGTPTVIDIIGKKRTVLSYILTPLERAAGVAFREQ